MPGGYRGDEEAQLVSARGGQWDTLGCMILYRKRVGLNDEAMVGICIAIFG
jgi:hypothetical protein